MDRLSFLGKIYDKFISLTLYLNSTGIKRKLKKIIIGQHFQFATSVIHKFALHESAHAWINDFLFVDVLYGGYNRCAYGYMIPENNYSIRHNIIHTISNATKKK